MRDILPDKLIDIIRDRYVAGVADAEAFYDQNCADEDALTGALGQAIAMKDPLTFYENGSSYTVEISYKKLRGRGSNAPERLYGPDGYFQIQVRDAANHVLRQKALPFQAKKNWQGRDSDLESQAEDINSSLGSGLAVNYTENGYSACSTEEVIEAHGDRKKTKKLSPLGQILGGEFLDCEIGVPDLFYDQVTERFSRGNEVLIPAHEITTRIIKMGGP